MGLIHNQKIKLKKSIEPAVVGRRHQCIAGLSPDTYCLQLTVIPNRFGSYYLYCNTLNILYYIRFDISLILMNCVITNNIYCGQ